MRYRIGQVWASRSSRLGKLLWNWPHLGIQRDFLVVPFLFFSFSLDRLVASYSYDFSFSFIYSPSFLCTSAVVSLVLSFVHFGDCWVVFPLTIVFRYC